MAQPNYLPQWMKDLEAWFNNPNVYMYGRWDQPAYKNEGGVDLTSPGGTPVYALEGGYLQGAGDFWHGGGNCLYSGGTGCSPGYGVVTIREDVPGYGLQDQYYQHINLNPSIPTCYAGNCNGAYVPKGTLLGWVNPAVGEVETGFNADWGGIWGVNHPGAWATDPRPMLAALLGEPAPTNVPDIGGVSGQSSANFGGTTTAQPEQSFQKVVLLLLAVGLIIGGIFFLFHKQIGQAAKAAVLA